MQELHANGNKSTSAKFDNPKIILTVELFYRVLEEKILSLLGTSIFLDEYKGFDEHYK